MTLTLLIDLDDTLIGNDMDTFIPAYLQALGKHLENHIDTSQLAPVMMAATENMFQNTRPDRTLKEAFDPDFYPKFGVREDQVSDTIEQFYAQVFPTLQSTTQIRPEAVELIKEGVRRGWNIAIATNPLFPLAAILHRLDWAGLSSQKYPFSIIPSYETFHFAKPNPAFFAELLGWFGWPRGPVIMVGNDPDHDIRGAQLMGIPTFWISNGLPYPEGFPAPSASGNLEDIIPWLDATSEDQLQPDYGTPTAVVATLSGIPSAWLGITSDLPISSWAHRPENGEWSLAEISCHLRDVEREVNLPRLEKIIREDTPFIPGIDTDAWAEQRDYQSQDGPSALRDFISARQETLTLLASLPSTDWQRPAHHAIFGPTDLREIASIVAGHDRLHIRQAHTLI